VFGTKPIWASKTALGAVIAVASLIASLFGLKIDDATQQVILSQIDAIITAAGVIVGAGLTIWGRLNATKSATLTGKPS